MTTVEINPTVAQTSRRLRTVVTLALVLLPLAFVGATWLALSSGTFADPAGPGTTVSASDLGVAGTVLLLAMRVLELAPGILAGLALRSLLTGWIRNEILTDHTARLVGRIGLCLVAMAAVRLVTSVASGPLLSALGALKRTVVHVDLDLTAGIIGLTLVCLSQVLAIAARVQREAELTI